MAPFCRLLARYLRALIQNRLAGIGVEAAGSTQEEFVTMIREEVARVGKVIREAGIQER